MAYAIQRQYSISEYLLHQSLNPEHELLELAAKVDWEEITYRLSRYYRVRGRQAKSMRLMVGLHLLKHRYNLSDEAVVAQLHENLYWQAFCGVNWPIRTDKRGKVIPTKLVEASTLTVFRKRIGPEGTSEIEAVLRDQMLSERVISRRVAIVDTTAQEKQIAYPLDTHLLQRGQARIISLMKRAKALGVRLPGGLRSFQRKSKQVLLRLVKLGQDRMERIEQGTKELISYAKHALRRVSSVRRGIGQKLRHEKRQTGERLKRLGTALTELAQRVERVVVQASERFKGIHRSNKIYSLHEPQVVCIRKGKRSRPDEYGSKVGFAVDRGGYVAFHQEWAENISDVKVLQPLLLGWQHALGRLPSELAGDRGMTPKRLSPPRLLSHIPHVALQARGKRPDPNARKSWFKRLTKKRAFIEPIISHLKSDHRMQRCRYKGFSGDRINISWAVMAWNTKKWMVDTSRRTRKKARTG